MGAKNMSAGWSQGWLGVQRGLGDETTPVTADQVGQDLYCTGS